MGNSLRNQPFPSLFSEVKTPVSIDMQQARIYACLGVIAFSFFLILPGIRGLERLWLLIRIFVGLWIGGLLLISNYSAWYGATVCTRTQYKPHVTKNAPQVIQAEVGLYIGLRGINITLLEKPCVSKDYMPPFPGESINYNERFTWANPWHQGRGGFGKFSGKFNQEYRAAKYRGIPYPISWVAEHFTIDGEQILWYRKFRLAGWYTHLIMWTAFVTHLLSVLFLMYNIRMGAYQEACTGVLMIMACLVYFLTINSDPILKIHFQDQVLVPYFKHSFWLTLGTGFSTLVIAILILVLERLCPSIVAKFFCHSVIQDDSFFEVDDDKPESAKDKVGTIPKRNKQKSSYSSPRSNSMDGTRKLQSDKRDANNQSIKSVPSTAGKTQTENKDFQCAVGCKMNQSLSISSYPGNKGSRSSEPDTASRDSVSRDSDSEMETQVVVIIFH